MKLLVTCEKVAAATSHIHHSATRMVVCSLGLAGAIYAFSDGVAGLLTVILAALEYLELAVARDY